jgi:hypothetical protein
MAKVKWEPPGGPWAVHLIHSGILFQYEDALHHSFEIYPTGAVVPYSGARRYFNTLEEAEAFKAYLEGNTWRGRSRCDFCFVGGSRCLMI